MPFENGKHSKNLIFKNNEVLRQQEREAHKLRLKKEQEERRSKKIERVESPERLKSRKTNRSEAKSFSKYSSQDKSIISSKRRSAVSGEKLFTRTNYKDKNLSEIKFDEIDPKTLTKLTMKQISAKIINQFMTTTTLKEKEKDKIKIPFLTKKLFRACTISDIKWIKQNVNFLKLKDLHFQDQNGNSPLYICVSRNNYEIAHYLIELGAKINQKNEYGNTPLHKAMMIGNMKMISMLIQMGADLTALNNYDLTPSDFGPKVLIKELGLQQLQTNMNTSIKNRIARGVFRESEFVYFDELSQKQKESLNKIKEKWMDIFQNLA